jgi:predicted ribonuclease YlaK
MSTITRLTDGVDIATISDINGKKAVDVSIADVTISAVDDSIETRSMAMKTLVDESSATLTYVGEAATGTTLSAALWRIKRITVSGTITTIEWANGNGSFANIWNNRASLSYS